MTIKEVENRTGLARSNIRFYEKEMLIAPSRNAQNGYRDYSEADVEDIKKIAYLRTLGISIEEIRNIMSKKTLLHEAIRKQRQALEEQITELNQARFLCQQMLDAKPSSYEELQVEQYVASLQDHWRDNRPVLQLDSVSFLYLWGSFLTWTVITALCLLVGILSYLKLPPEVPVQWSGGAASSLADKKFIFAYPVACIAIRYLLRPCIYAKMQLTHPHSQIIAEYLSNYLCFLALSIQVFSVLFIYNVVKNIVLLLLVNTIVLVGLLALGIIKPDFRKK